MKRIIFLLTVVALMVVLALPASAQEQNCVGQGVQSANATDPGSGGQTLSEFAQARPGIVGSIAIGCALP